MLPRVLLALLFCTVTAAAQADGRADRLVATFAKVCLAKPGTMSEVNTLAVAQGFALDKAGAAALAAAESSRADPFNLLLFWTSGAGESRMKLTGLISGNAERYELGCIVDGYGVPAKEVLASLKPMLGEPSGRTVKDNNWIEVTWAESGDRRGTMTLSYKEGGPRIGLTLVQMLGAAKGR